METKTNLASKLVTGLLGLLASGAVASVRLEVRPVQPVLEAAAGPQRTTLQIALEGVAPPRGPDRAPVNMVLVLDRSGSMGGDKIENVRRAALSVVDRLGASDVLSVVAYDTRAEVLLPAMPVRDKETIRRRILALNAGGSTALFAGVSLGLAQARTYQGGGRVTRVMLLSDGQANVGPSSPSELAALGRSAAKEGIPVSTIGLGMGYNEDLMQQLAQASDGNHDFAAEPTDLARIFDRELGEAMDVVASDISIHFTCPTGVRLIRVLDRDAEIRGQELSLRWSQLAGGQRKYVLVEVEVPASRAGSRMNLGAARADLLERSSGSRKRYDGTADIGFSGDRAVARASVDKAAKVSEVRALVNENAKKAVALRDQGFAQAPAARAAFESNAAVLSKAAEELGDNKLREEAEVQKRAAGKVSSDSDWARGRKDEKARQHKTSNQAAW